jgi:hypothetical protein
VPKQGLTDITFVLDRSGSMQSVAADTVGAFNKFVADQKAVPGECLLTLVQFDHEYEFVYRGTPIRDVPPLDVTTYMPRGWTALLDAVGRAVNETGARLAALPEHDRPEHVVFVILTDGHENSSKEFDRAKVMALIKHQTETYSWQFLFLGANQDAIAAGAAIGVIAANAMSYAGTGVGTSSAIAAPSRNVANLRCGFSRIASYTAGDREEQARLGVPGVTTGGKSD